MATKDKLINLEDLKVLSDHVEGEVTDLKSDLENIPKAIGLSFKNASSNLFDENNTDNIYMGQWWTVNNGKASIATISSTWQGIDIPVSDISAITFSYFGQNGIQPKIRRWYCVDDDYTVLSSDETVNIDTNVPTTIPVSQGTTHFLITTLSYQQIAGTSKGHLIANAGSTAQPFEGYWTKLEDNDGNKYVSDSQLSEIEVGKKTIRPEFFANGLFSNSVPIYATYRAITTTFVVFDHDAYVSVENGFRYSYVIYDGDNKTDYGFRTYDSFIPSGSVVRFCIARVAESASETVDVSVFATKLFILTSTETKITEIENANNALSILDGNMEYVGVAGNCGSLVSNCAESITFTAHAGFDGIEIDVRLNADGVPILTHYEDISHYTDAPSGTLASTVTTAQMKEYKYASYDYLYSFYAQPIRLITLAECFALAKKYHMRVYVDIKADGYDLTHQTDLLDAVIANAISAGVENSCCFESELQTSRMYIRSKLPNAIIGYKVNIIGTTAAADIDGVKSIGGNVMLQAECPNASYEDYLTAERIAAYRMENLPIQTIDYLFTTSRPYGLKSGRHYAFTFEKRNGAWGIVSNFTSSIADDYQTTLAEDANNSNILHFVCDGLYGDMIRKLMPQCDVFNSSYVPVNAYYSDQGIDLIFDNELPNNAVVKVAIAF